MKQFNDKKLSGLLKEKNAATIRTFLEDLSEKEKGIAFEGFLAELYQGNGWLVELKGGRGDKGADILLYHPKTSSKASYIIQAKNHSKPLTFDQTKIELIKFEEQSAKKYDCQQFRIVAINGFVKEAQKLSRFNLSLKAWEHVAELIAKYDPEKITEPQIDLFPHNETTYQRVRELWTDTNKVAVVQATGTGKSFVIAKVMADFLNDTKLVMAPSKYILKQQKDLVPWASHSTIFMTYAKSAKLTKAKIKNLDAKLIVLDEFHRCGAEIWGQGVQRILEAHPEAYILGTTATPIRYLDDSRDMSDELFDNAIAEDLSLAQAIVRNILPAPDYVAALYTLDEEINDLMETLKESKKPQDEKKEIAAQINKAKLDWEKTSGISEILKKHISANTNKFIIFCKDKKHLDKMEWVVESWFQKAGLYKRRKKYRVISEDQENDRNLIDFKAAKSQDTAHLLFAIDMLNEGLHIPDVGAVILLRPTESPIVFYQQIGRCIQVGAEHTPIIFDFVNNFQSIRANDFLQDLEEAKIQEARQRAELGLEEYSPKFRIVDETKKILELFERISERLQPWEVMFEQLKTFREKQGHCNVPSVYIENRQLGTWVFHQRGNRESLSPEKIAKLDSIGFDWNPLETTWNQMFDALVDFKKKHGHCNVPALYLENRKLGIWVFRQRGNKDTLPPEKIAKLESIGFDWDPFETAWHQMFSQLVDFKEKHGHCKVSKEWKDNKKLGTWVSEQRKHKSRLSFEKIAKLDSIGFVWDPLETTWNQMFSQLVAFKEKYGNCNVPLRWQDNQNLGTWVGRQRRAKDRLSPEKIAKLDSLGFDWDPIETYWNQMFKELKSFTEKHGHCNVSRELKLGAWVSQQRVRKSRLSPEKIAKLDSIGFDWVPLETAWNQMLSRLVTFKEKHGHCNVPMGWKDNKKLGIWVSVQRRPKSLLSPEKIAKLDSIGFDWDPNETYWNQMFEELVAFKKKHGHCNVPLKWTDNKKLGIWVGRLRHSKNTLSPEKIAKLDSVGFDWDPNETYWNQMFEELKTFRENQGHFNAPRYWKKNKQLGSWVHNQRVQKDSLSSERITKLDSIGFIWDPLETAWNQMFNQLEIFKEKHGHCDVPQRSKENRKLGVWVRHQRGSKDTLSSENVAKLNSIGFVWDPFESAWNQMFGELKGLREKQGHCNVPQQRKENRQLAKWVGRQRTNKDTLSSEKKANLDSIGFDWEPIENTWNQRFEELVAFKEKHGHCNVPAVYIENKNLGIWVGTQRRNKDTLSSEKIAKLDSIGFDWDPLESAWSQMFKELKSFREKQGHCDVPLRWEENRQLGSWVRNQRSAKGRLSPERIAKLDSMGFDWDSIETAWNQMFEELKYFREKHGHCNVPNKWKENKKLGLWVSNQRLRKDGQSSEKIAKLDSIGFEWKRQKK